MENNDRTALIERLRDATEGPRMLMNEAATMLEADAVPQEPVAILNHAHGLHAIRSVKLDGLPDGEYKLYAAPQRPRLTDAEIDALAEWHALDFMTYMPFARAIEKKVRGEA